MVDAAVVVAACACGCSADAGALPATGTLLDISGMDDMAGACPAALARDEVAGFGCVAFGAVLTGAGAGAATGAGCTTICARMSG